MTGRGLGLGCGWHLGAMGTDDEADEPEDYDHGGDRQELVQETIRRAIEGVLLTANVANRRNLAGMAASHAAQDLAALDRAGGGADAVCVSRQAVDVLLLGADWADNKLAELLHPKHPFHVALVNFRSALDRAEAARRDRIDTAALRTDLAGIVDALAPGSGPYAVSSPEETADAIVDYLGRIGLLGPARAGGWA